MGSVLGPVSVAATLGIGIVGAVASVIPLSAAGIAIGRRSGNNSLLVAYCSLLGAGAATTPLILWRALMYDPKDPSAELGLFLSFSCAIVAALGAFVFSLPTAIIFKKPSDRLPSPGS